MNIFFIRFKNLKKSFISFKKNSKIKIKKRPNTLYALQLQLKEYILFDQKRVVEAFPKIEMQTGK